MEERTINVMLVWMVGFGLHLTVHVQVSFFFFFKITTFLVDLFLTMFWISDCGCNLSGTMGGSSTCDETGICTCDASAGYSGGQNDKCDDCLDGWYWTASDSTCRSKIISSL